MWISVIAVGVILGAILVKEQEKKRAKALVPIKIKSDKQPNR